MLGIERKRWREKEEKEGGGWRGGRKGGTGWAGGLGKRVKRKEGEAYHALVA